MTSEPRERTRRFPPVFVVDDDEAVLDSLGVLLDSAGFDVRGFPSAHMLLERDDVGDAGALVLDVRLDGVSGFEVVRRLRAKGVGVPVILITGHLEAVSTAHTEAEGILAILQKPFDSGALLAALERAFRLHEARNERDS